MKIFLATWMLEPAQGDALSDMKCKRRLMSYFHTKEKESDFDKYVKTGRNKKK